MHVYMHFRTNLKCHLLSAELTLCGFVFSSFLNFFCVHVDHQKHTSVKVDTLCSTNTYVQTQFKPANCKTRVLAGVLRWGSHYRLTDKLFACGTCPLCKQCGICAADFDLRIFDYIFYRLSWIRAGQVRK